MIWNKVKEKEPGKLWDRKECLGGVHRRKRPITEKSAVPSLNLASHPKKLHPKKKLNPKQERRT